MRGMHVRRARAPAPHLRPGSVLLLLLLACAATCVAAAPEAVATCGAGAQEGGAALQALMAEANERLLQLGQVSDAADRLQRTFYSPAHRRAAALLAAWMEDAGLRVWHDAVGNVHGRVEGSSPCAALLLGSHYDTVLDGGRYDGALGVVVAITALKAALRELAPGAALRCPVEIIAFSDEEGVRFQSTFLGSKAVAGTLAPEALNVMDEAGVTLAQVLLQSASPSADYATLLADVRSAAAAPGSVRAYVEVHIEQGPVLESSNAPLGVVTAIAGQTRLAVSITGEQGHAGTVPMTVRRDALAGAAEAIVAIERRCRDNAPDDGLVCTVGQTSVWPGASNVIAGAVNFTVDIRSRQDAVRLDVVADVGSRIAAICDERHLGCTVHRKHDAAAMECSPALRPSLEAAVAAVNAPLVAVPLLVSGAGHDGLAMADLCPVSMLFVRCRGGVSHSPAEFVAPEDVQAAVGALLHLLRATA